MLNYEIILFCILVSALALFALYPFVKTIDYKMNKKSITIADQMAALEHIQ